MNTPIPVGIDLTRFYQLVKQNELNQQVSDQLYTVLSTCEIVLLCDDSDSMNKSIAEEGTDPFAPKRSTRWLELKKLASIIIDFVSAINQNGLDIYFLNRPGLTNVVSLTGLQGVFAQSPNGGTPLITTLNKIYHDKAHIPHDKRLLIVVITDGEPTDGTRNDLYHTLCNKKHNVHISFAECTDNAEDMEYLDQWNCTIRNFDNTDDYREELNRVKMVQGQQFKFDFTDYVIKILLATFVRWYFQLDQTKVTQNYTSPTFQQQYQPQQQYQQSQPQQQYQPQQQAQAQVYQANVTVKTTVDNTNVSANTGTSTPNYTYRNRRRGGCTIF